MTAVVLAPAEAPESAALVSALEAGLGPVAHVPSEARAREALDARPRAVLVVDLRGAGSEARAGAEALVRSLVARRCLALVDTGPPPAGVDAVFTPPFYLEEVVRWCARATVAPLAEGILADLAAGLGHEIGNPLTSLFLQLELLKADDDLVSVREHLGQIEESARRIQSVIRDVASAAENHPVVVAPTGLLELLDRARERLAVQAPDLVERLVLGGQDRGLHVDGELLSAALADVWEYLLRAGRRGDALEVGTRIGPFGTCRIDSRAHAPRLPADAAGRLFTPLWARQALGLPGGLSLTSARNAFLRHRGDLRARQAVDGRLLVEALLPAEAQSTFEFAR